MKFIWAVAALASIAACTSNGSSPAGDDDDDGDIDTSPHGIATVHTTPGAPVAFLDHGGHGAIVTADASGLASGTVSDDGSVTTLVEGGTDIPFLVTRLGVRISDDIDVTTTDYVPLQTGTPTCGENVSFAASYTNAAASGVSYIGFGRFTADGPTIDGEPNVASDPAVANVTAPAAVEAFLGTALVGPEQGLQQEREEVIDGCATTHAVDLGSLLPWTEAPTWDGNRFTMAFTGGTRQADIQHLLLSYQLASGGYVTWSIVGPQSPIVKLPHLPDELLPYNLTPDTALHSSSVELIDFETLDGYEQARPVFKEAGSVGVNFTPSRFGAAWRSYRIVLN